MIESNQAESDELLIEDLAAGNAEVLNRLYLEHKSGFVSWAISKYGIEENRVKDIYQDAIIIIYEKAIDGNLVLESSFKTFVYAIGKNLLLQEIDKKTRIGKHSDRMNEHFEFLSGLGDTEIYEKRVDATKSWLENLEEPCRSILISYYFYKKSMIEIAETFGYKSPDVAKTQKNRCLNKLRTKVTELM